MVTSIGADRYKGVFLVTIKNTVYSRGVILK